MRLSQISCNSVQLAVGVFPYCKFYVGARSDYSAFISNILQFGTTSYWVFAILQILRWC